MAKHAVQNLSIARLFGLAELSEQEDIPRIVRTRSAKPLYLCSCEGLLPDGYRLAIDESRGMVGLMYEGKEVAERQVFLTPHELLVVTALILSYPFPVDHVHVQGLSDLSEADHQETGGSSHTTSLQAVMTTCNICLNALGIRLSSTETACWLEALHANRHRPEGSRE
jgi:hypothetical protein